MAAESARLEKTRSDASAPSDADEIDKTDTRVHHSNTLYYIRCHDSDSHKEKSFELEEDPFVRPATQAVGSSKAKKAVEAHLSVIGVNAPSAWRVRPPSPPPPWGGIPPPPPPRGRFSGPPPQVPIIVPRQSSSTTSEATVTKSSTDIPDSEKISSSAVSDDDDEFGEKVEEKQSPTRQAVFGSFEPTKIHLESIYINSKGLINLLRSVVGHFPGHALSKDGIVMDEPFLIMFYYYEDLRKIQAAKKITVDVNLKSEHQISKHYASAATTVDLDNATLQDLATLLDIYEPYHTQNYAEERATWDLGLADFSKLRYLYKPGARLYARIGGKLAGFICKTVVQQELRGINSRDPRPWWLIKCWHLTYNGQRIVRSPRSFSVRPFDGNKEIISLPVFPVKYWDKEEEATTLLERLGEKFFKIIRESPAHMRYAGPCWDFGMDSLERPNTAYTGEIVVDYRPKRESRLPPPPLPPMPRGQRRPPPPRDFDDSSDDYSNSDEEDEGGDVELDTKGPREKFLAINPFVHKELTKSHYFLLNRRLVGFALSQKQRMDFDVELIQPILWPATANEILGTLILDESDKDVVTALTQKYITQRETWAADWTHGKGEGQIFLLHGPPGTGKTYTVECVAQATRRPLLRLTVADIGTNEQRMEDILKEWFERGADWGAIILIDEADVFLEKRQVKDLKRNSLVSVFLSCMEYYTGMLFLTTNRIGQIDDAFLSRISVALHYRSLDFGKQRQIWEGFLKKLGEERKDIVLTDRAKKLIFKMDQDETMKDVPWNGREIRNALQTAIALASRDAEKEAEDTETKVTRIVVGPEHFQAVIDRRKEFVEYRKSIRNQDEDTRAYQEGSRAPPRK